MHLHLRLGKYGNKLYQCILETLSGWWYANLGKPPSLLWQWPGRRLGRHQWEFARSSRADRRIMFSRAFKFKYHTISTARSVQQTSGSFVD